MMVKKSTLNDAIYAELGRVPLLVIRKIPMVKFTNRIHKLGDIRLVKKTLNMQILDDI